MSKTGYTIRTEGAVALAAATAKSVLGVKGNAAFGVDLQGLYVDFDGVTASATPVLCELCYCTWATNSPGTNSTSVSANYIYGKGTASGMTAAKTWTTEPTALTAIDSWSLDPNKGLYRYDWPYGQTPDSAVGEGYVLRLTAAAIVNARAGFRVERA
jgi:hypothetical protein